MIHAATENSTPAWWRSLDSQVFPHPFADIQTSSSLIDPRT
ncbi:hypothetical protein BLA23254_02607 [Burkholderia lata]|uniref:Uncharacterized protein n=1 Tax=Burkholderia lata (strain ATCC 17760 / DSM 23089 / LMG 22485 / NCIMB 9086 / R18194 / 383) TaxID=482957 RepID=A0A6P2KQ69_BURL3|nr:hypothetical protein BLA23254_02607 [Burkholderia lata]